MKKGRTPRNKITIVVFVLVVLICYCNKISPISFDNFTDLMNGSLSFSAITTGLFLTCFTLAPSLSKSKLMQAMVDMKTDLKLMDRLLVATLIFFLNALFSLIELTFNSFDFSTVSVVSTSFWAGLLLAGISEVFQIIHLLFSTIQELSNQ